MTALRVLIVDDEALARSRLRTLLAECASPQVELVGEAASGEQALQALADTEADLLLADIHMPGLDGLALARAVAMLSRPPAVVFVTAHASYAVDAFELAAMDYLTKPVRAQRLAQALQKVARQLQEQSAAAPVREPETLLIQERGRTERVPLDAVVYLKSELKYVTVRTATHTHVLDGTLAQFEERHGTRFLRVHRNALVARSALRALERASDAEDADAGWVLRLDGVPELLAVSRRQLVAVREALKETP